jgi:hypothetical protein
MRIPLGCLGLLTIALLSGCLEDGPPQTAPQTPDEAGRTGVSTLEGAFPYSGSDTFGWDAGAGYEGIEAASVMADHSVDLRVEPGAKRLVLAIDWQCATDATCDLQVSAHKDGEDPTQVFVGSGHVDIEVEDPAPGKWYVGAISNGATAAIEGTVTWTVHGPTSAA